MKKRTRIIFQSTEKLKARLKKIAKAKNTSVSNLIRQALELYHD